ncbi:hypothetical protein B0H14DRAFT_3164314 [Mycena olivaceomarginata]|nr:hypothetical protein B0H14DRAFT_3164314 [Mycena olivaceomarginata]
MCWHTFVDPPAQFKDVFRASSLSGTAFRQPTQRGPTIARLARQQRPYYPHHGLSLLPVPPAFPLSSPSIHGHQGPMLIIQLKCTVPLLGGPSAQSTYGYQRLISICSFLSLLCESLPSLASVFALTPTPFTNRFGLLVVKATFGSQSDEIAYHSVKQLKYQVLFDSSSNPNKSYLSRGVVKYIRDPIRRDCVPLRQANSNCPLQPSAHDFLAAGLAPGLPQASGWRLLDQLDDRLDEIRNEAKNEAKKLTRGFHHVLTHDQDKHGAKDYVLDETTVDDFQQQVDDIIAVDTATSTGSVQDSTA